MDYSLSVRPDVPIAQLSVSYPGLRPQMDYVPQEAHGQTAAFLANYHRAREIDDIG
ncbi:MAG: hypothetical protein ACRD7E_03710 [Bryobacteraceae bacterium]